MDFVKPIGMDYKAAKELYRSAMRRYYRSRRLPLFFNLSRKEFGVGDFGRKIVRRYITFNTSSDLYSYLRNEAPPYISYSVADWQYPAERDDAQRGFLGAELIYEFDDDEFVKYSPEDIAYCPICKDIHTVGELLEKGYNPLYCVKCGSRRDVIPLPSKSRWSRIVYETKRILEILIEDFNVPPRYIHLNYSGNRGIHIHVTDNRYTDAKVMFPNYRNSLSVMNAMQDVRKEMAEYFSLSNFDAQYIRLRLEEDRITGPTISYGGMVGRIVREIHRKLRSTNNPYVFHKYISNPTERDAMERLLSAAGNRKMAELVSIGLYDNGIGNTTLLNAWRSVFNGIARELAIPFDVQTSTDIKRLIRLPESIHGTTGLAAKGIKHQELDHFNPYSDAVVLPERPKITLWIRYLPEVEFDGKKYGPYNEEEVDLPLNFGIYLLGVFGYWERGGDSVAKEE